MSVRFEDPFVTPRDERRPDRRLRGRLVAPVTIWTAGAGAERAGLTVSSLLVAEGDPPLILGIIDPLSDFHRAVEESGRFIVHVLANDEERAARLFAGAYPVDPFDELAFAEDEFGPFLPGHRPTVRCRFVASETVGFQAVLRGEIASVEPSEDPGDPLAWYRGSYRSLS